MSFYDQSNIFNKILTLEDKVERLEETIRYEDSERYSFTKTPYYYKSAIKLSNATRDLKQDLLQNPHHNNLDRDNYQEIYNRVSFLEKELNNVLYNMNFQNRDRPTPKSNYNYVSNMESPSILYYDEPKCLKGRDLLPKRHIIQRKPQTKRVSYDRYVTVIPSDTSSSDSVEEIIYYIESPTSSSSSSSSTSVVIEEYVPKKYTRRSFRRPPIIDVSKSRPKASIKKSVPKSTTKHKRKSPGERSPVKQPKVKKSKKDKKTLQVGKTKSTTATSDEKSETYLVKRSIESPKDTNKTKNKKKKEKFFVSRLKKMESSDNEENNENESEQNRTNAAKSETESTKRGIKQRGKSEENQTNRAKFKKNNKRRIKKKHQSAEQSTDTIVVAHSSFILNDPLVHTLHYDDFDSVEEKYVSNKSESEEENVSQGNNHIASKYEISNSFYSFDPFFKQKEKFYRTNKLNEDNLSYNVNHNSTKNKARICNVDDTIELNDDELKSQQKKITLKKAKTSRDGKTIPCKQIEKDRPIAKDEKSSISFDGKCNSRRSSKMPVAHSVYLTTVPIYQTSLHDLKSPLCPPINTEKIIESNSKKGRNSETVEITSHHGMILEDEILMNVAKKLSPIVAKMISSGYHKSKDESKAKLISSTKNSNSAKSINFYLFDKNGTQSKVLHRPIYSEHSLLLPVKDKRAKDSSRMGKYSKSGENEIMFIEVINSYDGNIVKPLIKSHIYNAELENNSPLQQTPSTKNSSLKKLKSLSSTKNLFRKRSKGKAEKGKQSDSVISVGKESNPYKQSHGSQISHTKKTERIDLPIKSNSSSLVYYGSQEYLNDIKSISQYNQIRRNPVQRSRRESLFKKEGEEQLTLENFPSLGPQSMQPKKSILKKTTNQENVKKSSSRFTNLLKRISTKAKVPSYNTQDEPALKNLITMMSVSDTLSKNVKQKESQEGHIPTVALQNSEKEPAVLNKIKSIDESSKILKQGQIQEAPILVEQVYSWQGLEKQPAIPSRMQSLDVSSKIFKQDQIQEPDKQLQYYSRRDSMININQLKSRIQSENMTDLNNIGQSLELTEYNKPEVHDLENNKSDSTIYDGSQAYLKKVRSVSQYDQYRLSPELIFSKDGNFERKASSSSSTKQFQPEEIIMAESLEKNNLNQQGNGKNIETANLERSPLQDSSEEYRIIQEVQDKPKKPLQFCIHFSKEKRSKFESQSTLLLDGILLSQCKKVCSSEDLSFSEYAFDGNKESYISRKKHPKKHKNYSKYDFKFSPCFNENNSMKYHDSFIKDIHSLSVSDCCCKKSKPIEREQFMSDSSYSLNWHKVANEIKEPN